MRSGSRWSTACADVSMTSTVCARRFRRVSGPFARSTIRTRLRMQCSFRALQSTNQTQCGAIGHLSGKITSQVLRYYADANMGLIVPAATTDSITAQGYRNVFRLPTKDSTEGTLHAKFVAKEKRGKKVAVVYVDGDYGPEVAGTFLKQTSGDGLNPVDVKLSNDRPDIEGAATDDRTIASRHRFLRGSCAGARAPRSSPSECRLERTIRRLCRILRCRTLADIRETDRGLDRLNVDAAAANRPCCARHQIAVRRDVRANVADRRVLLTRPHRFTSPPCSGSARRRACWSRARSRNRFQFRRWSGRSPSMRSEIRWIPTCTSTVSKVATWHYVRAAHPSSYIVR